MQSSSKQWWRQNWVHVAAISGLFIATAILAIVTVKVATSAPANRTAAALLQVMTLALGIVASVYTGRRTARTAAEDVLRPHARSAFRRVLSLFQAFGRLEQSIDDRTEDLTQIANANSGNVEIASVRLAMNALRSQVIEQVGTASDAMADWRDIVPEEVEKIEKRIREDQISPPDIG